MEGPIFELQMGSLQLVPDCTMEPLARNKGRTTSHYKAPLLSANASQNKQNFRLGDNYPQAVHLGCPSSKTVHR